MTLPKFVGSKEELKTALKEVGVEGRFNKRPDGHPGIRVKAPNGAVLDWWASTGSARLQGEDVADLQTAYEAALAHIYRERKRRFGLCPV